MDLFKKKRGGQLSKCPWCNELDCEHCRCTGYDFCLHKKNSQCLKPRYKRRRVCNPCGGSRDRQRVNTIRHSRRSRKKSQKHASFGMDSMDVAEDIGEHVNHLMRGKVDGRDEVKLKDAKISTMEPNSGEKLVTISPSHPTTTTTNTNTIATTTSTTITTGNCLAINLMGAPIHIGLPMQYPVPTMTITSTPNMVMLDQNQLMVAMLQQQSTLSHTGITTPSSSSTTTTTTTSSASKNPSDNSIISGKPCRYCHQEIDFSKAIDVYHAELLRHKHECHCAVLYYEKTSTNRGNNNI
jgi:hypothetical protein